MQIGWLLSVLEEYDFEIADLQLDRWSDVGDRAEVTLESREVRIYLTLILGDKNHLCWTEIAVTVEDNDGAEIQTTNLRNLKPLELSQSPVQFWFDVAYIADSLQQWQREVDDLALKIQPKYWIPEKGRRVNDIVYAYLSALFVRLESAGTIRVLEKCAEYMDVNYETAKSRIRFARERGLLTKPGQGASSSTKLTTKSLRMLEGK